MCYVLLDIQHIDGTKGSLVCKICNHHWSLITRIVFRFILDRTPFSLPCIHELTNINYNFFMAQTVDLGQIVFCHAVLSN